jgi:hypothetical protein
MTMFYSPSTGGFYDDSFKPNDAIELTDDEYALLVSGQRGSGFTVRDGVVVVVEPIEIDPPPESVELAWRDAEIEVVMDNLKAIMFDDPEALPGSESQWKAYGVALRRWEEGAEGFPLEEHRPSRPA